MIFYFHAVKIFARPFLIRNYRSTMPLSLYIHVPFCASRCSYCDFYSTTAPATMRQRYVRALCEEIRLRSAEFPDASLHTIYFGGGTPSQLQLDELATILQTIRRAYTFEDEMEVTLEANPDDVYPGWGRRLLELGINRVSLGVQSLDDVYLRLINRRHSAAQAMETVQQLHSEGVPHISIDLIYALPGQTLDHWVETLETALRLPIDHLSAYQLTYEPDTLITRQMQAATIPPSPDEEVVRQMYMHLIQRTSDCGMPQYEISNFARPGCHSRHNSVYWTGGPYVGVGPGAHSYDGRNVRRSNAPSLSAYIENLAPTSPSTLIQQPPHQTEHLDEEALLLEHLFLNLRRIEGINLTTLQSRWPAYIGPTFRHRLQQYLTAGHLYQPHLETYALTPHGMLISDYIISELAAALAYS